MKIKVSDYIAEYFVAKNLTEVFTVVGGGAMHLNDSFGHDDRLHCVYHHHEQACSMAAEGYARVTNRPAVVCVTSGPGAINALNGVAGAYQDSIPMIVVSGQVKSTLLEKTSGLSLRTLGGQEFDIVSAVSKMTKYAETVLDASEIPEMLDKAYSIAVSGRPGPCWLDIPVDIQGTTIEVDGLPKSGDIRAKEKSLINPETIAQIKEKIKTAKRPVIYAGNGIRLSGGMEEFKKLVETLQIPVVTCWDSIDLIENANPMFCGRAGIMGDRAGNFAVQNSDLLICIGNRLSIYQVGYNVDTWAREAYVVAVDIDENELKKKIVRIDLPIVADAKDFMTMLIDATKDISASERLDWNKKCNYWKAKYPVVTGNHYEQEETNVYAFMNTLSTRLPEGSHTVVANGSASVVGSSSYSIGKNCRFIMNCAISSMGYGLPSSIGVATALKGKDNKVICIEGDGSIMMNLQELATVKANNLPIKIFLINNEGYHQIRQTQNNIFNNGYVGVGPASGDLCFPKFSEIADAFGITYKSIDKNDMLEDVIDDVLNMDGSVLCEVFVDTNQKFEPKSATKKLEDGSLFSPPLEDLAPFLSREELEENMIIPMVEE